MNEYEISLGEATYQIHREYSGDRPLSELLVEQLLRKKLPPPKFDSTPAPKV